MDRIPFQVIVLVLLTCVQVSEIRCKPSDTEGSGHESLCDKVCETKYEPVCGTDGKSYWNLCELQIIWCRTNGSVSMACDGKCPCPESLCDKVCEAKYEPVCGTDGKSYWNGCELQIIWCRTNGSVSLACDGKCPCPVPTIGQTIKKFAEKCFHDQSEVMTPRGPKNLRDVSPGEEVLTVSDSGCLRYEPVIIDLHRDHRLHTWFYKIQTSMNEIMVTPNHYVYVGETVESSKLVTADDVRVGDILIVNTNSTLGTAKVTCIEFTYDQGISNPLVSSGRILVNNILAAVYVDDFSPFKAKHLHFLMWWSRMLSSMKIDIVDMINEKSGMPYWAAYGEHVLRKFV